MARERPPGSGRERGSASAEMVVLLPMLFVVLFSGVQGALFYHARTLASAAAQEGARTAAAEHGTLSAGTAAAAGFLDEVAGDSLTGVTVTGTRTATVATVTVGGTSLSIVPGWTLTVEQSATLPVERIT
jgi:Flp pilus assembly protein TadG